MRRVVPHPAGKHDARGRGWIFRFDAGVAFSFQSDKLLRIVEMHLLVLALRSKQFVRDPCSFPRASGGSALCNCCGKWERWCMYALYRGDDMYEGVSWGAYISQPAFCKMRNGRKLSGTHVLTEDVALSLAASSLAVDETFVLW